MKVNKYIKILISIIAIAIIAIIYYFLADFSPDIIDTSNDIEGQINFVLKDENEQILINDSLDFYEEDTLFTLLKRNYDIVCADQNYQPDPSCSHKFLAGRVILAIEDLDSNWTDTFLTIYVNDKLATSGVSNITLNDGDQITIKRTDYNE